MTSWNWDHIRLYVITGEQYHPGRSVPDVIERALQGGAGIVQLRNKTAGPAELLEQARELRGLTRRYGVPLIINDYPEIAAQADADGVHLGQEDGAIEDARRLLGPDKIIGISTHGIGQALAAERAGADYIGVGPVYPTGTKPGRKAVTTSYVAEAARQVRIPFFAIGGITPDNADEVLAAGARRLCAVSAIVGSADPREASRLLLARIEEADRRRRGAGLRITVNGLPRETRSATVGELVSELGQQEKRVLVELDGAIVERAQWRERQLTEGCAVELIQFVGGG